MMQTMSAITAIVAVCAAFVAFADRIEIAQNRESALYKVGEEAVFTVTVKDDSGEIRKDGATMWTLDNFGTRRLATGKAGLDDGTRFTFVAQGPVAVQVSHPDATPMGTVMVFR